MEEKVDGALQARETPRDRGLSRGQRSLACCSPWGLKESDTTWRWNIRQYCWELYDLKVFFFFFQFIFFVTISRKPNDTLQIDGLSVEVEKDDPYFLLEHLGTWVSVTPHPSVGL